MLATSDLVELYSKVEAQGYVLLPDDYIALGYCAMRVNDYRRVWFVLEQANNALRFLNPISIHYQMAKYEDGTYGVR